MSRLQVLIEETVTALTALDAATLARIQAEVETLRVHQFSVDEDLAAAMLAHRVLGKLLRETERNLRLFRITTPWVEQASGPGFYGMLPESSDSATRG